MTDMKKFLNIIAPFAFMLILNTVCLACSMRKEESKKDDFLNTVKTEEPKDSRIKIIEGSQWTLYQIVEVDGHQYLCNAAHGGMIHLESCPCKKGIIVR
jgi:hypothetical protein